MRVIRRRMFVRFVRACRRSLGGLLVLAGSLAAADEGEPTRPPQGTLVIAGGCERFDNAAVWTRVVRAAGGTGASLAVISAADPDPARANATAAALVRYGAAPFVVSGPASAETVARVAAAGGVFFTGGDQRLILDAVTERDGRLNPLGEAVWSVYRRGGLVGGSSAGAAIMSRIMYRDAPWVLQTMTRGVTWGKEIGPGLGFMPPEWFIEQHALTYGRIGRCLVAMCGCGPELRFPFGLAIDEDTAVVVHRAEGGTDLVADVIGSSAVLLVDLSRARCDGRPPQFRLKGARLNHLEHGDSINLRTREIHVAAERRAGQALGPDVPGYHPLPLDRPLFSSDILGYRALVDLMTRLVESPAGAEAVGLAFDGQAAERHETPGYRFRLYRTPETRAWHCEASGGDDYTILELALDVAPISIRGPLVEDPSDAHTE